MVGRVLVHLVGVRFLAPLLVAHGAPLNARQGVPTMSKKATAGERAAAAAELSKVLAECQRENGRPTLYFIVRSVAASGMSRVFSVYVIDQFGPRGLDYLISTACEYTRTAEGFRIGGCGMDMRFAVADSVARLVGTGYGAGCNGIANGNDIAYRSL